MIARRIIVRGRVQGVGFRHAMVEAAREADVDLALCMSYANRKNRPLSHVFRYLDRIEEIDVTREGRAVIAKLVGDLDVMAEMASRYPTGRVLYEYLVNQTGYIGRLTTSGRPEDEQRVANIAKFFDLVSRFAGRSQEIPDTFLSKPRRTTKMCV